MSSRSRLYNHPMIDHIRGTNDTLLQPSQSPMSSIERNPPLLLQEHDVGGLKLDKDGNVIAGILSALVDRLISEHIGRISPLVFS